MATTNFNVGTDKHTSTDKHTFCYGKGKISVEGVVKVVQISERECVFRLDGQTLTLRGSGLSVTKLDRDGGTVVLDVDKLSSATYGSGVKGLFS